MASSQSHARVINTRMALSTTRKGNLTITQYVGKMKALADDMAVAGKKLDVEELVGYILATMILILSYLQLLPALNPSECPNSMGN
jgi:hypothetical protein